MLCVMVDELAFSPVGGVPAGVAELDEDIRDDLEPLADYFNMTYISGNLSTRSLECQHPDYGRRVL